MKYLLIVITVIAITVSLFGAVPKANNNKTITNMFTKDKVNSINMWTLQGQ